MTHTTKLSLSLLLAFSIFIVQVGRVFALPDLQDPPPFSGSVHSLTLETDATTGVATVIVEVVNGDQDIQTVRLSLETAISLGLVVLNGDGKPEINHVALGKAVEIEPQSAIPDHPETQHPVGSALATFFSDIAGIDYETVMRAREQGVGFGVIAQTLWLTKKLEGDAEIFEALLHAKQSGDYSAFILEDGSSPENWGQLRRAILNKDKKNGVGIVIANVDANGNGNENDKDNNGNGTGTRKDKEKDKDKGNGKGKNK